MCLCREACGLCPSAPGTDGVHTSQWALGWKICLVWPLELLFSAQQHLARVVDVQGFNIMERKLCFA